MEPRSGNGRTGTVYKKNQQLKSNEKFKNEKKMIKNKRTDQSRRQTAEKSNCMGNAKLCKSKEK